MKNKKSAKRAMRSEHGAGLPAAGSGGGGSGGEAANAEQPPILRAIALQNQGKAAEAELLLRQILAAHPDDGVALYSLIVILMRQPQGAAEALRLAEHGVAVAAAFAPLWMARAGLLQAAGRQADALASYDQAIALQPDYTEALVNSGVLLRDMHRHRDALLRFNQVLTFNPDYAIALANCAILLTEFKQSTQAIAMFERLLKVQPDYDYLPGLLNYERLHVCDWTDFAPLVERIVNGVRAGKRTSKTLGLMAISDDAADHFQAARTFARHWFGQERTPLWQGERYGHARLRIAYVSPDLREHPVGHLMAGIFERHDKTRFETYAISLGIDDGSRLRQRMVAAFDHFIDARAMGAREIAELMRGHEIDIAIDLAGYTSDSRTDLFSYRPAPVQASFLGYPGTLATPFVDTIIADRHVLPPEHQRFYTERVAYLPHAYLPTDDGIRIAERTPTRAECGLPDTGAVLCSFSHDYKIHPDLYARWMRILQKTPGSVLWLVSRNDLSQGNLRRAAERHGIDPARLVFATRVPRVEDHLARYRLADVFLDTWPYNAHTTAADALMAGLPVLTTMGNAFPARVAGSLLHAIGLPELIAASADDYEALAVALVTDRERLAAVKAKLARNKATHPLFDTARFCRDFEGLLLGLAPAAATPPAEAAALRADLDAAHASLAAANHPLAELHLRRYLAAGGSAVAAQSALDGIARGYGVAPDFRLVEPAAPAPGRHLLVKAWGYGFWSDVHHVVGQLLVAELTGRTPVVHWGANSLFGDGSGADAFGHYFAPVSDATLASLPLDAAAAIYPPKWRPDNLHADNVDKWSGAGARLAAQFLFARTEPLVVSDFYATVASLLPWIGPASAYHGLTENEIYTRLFAKHLRPLPHIAAQVDAFHAAHLAGRRWVAVHVRGSDKVLESAGLHQTNARYVEFIDRIIELNPGIGVFLLTDARDLQLHYSARYGDRLVTTAALRSSSQQGVHLQGHAGRQVGTEVLVDALLATRCDYFVGNQESNVSLAVASLKPWRQGLLVMLGDKNCRSDNFFLHQVAAPAAAPPAAMLAAAAAVEAGVCRLCAAPVRHLFDKDVLGRLRVGYHVCSGCGSLQTELPHWLDAAYSGAAERYDTGKASRTLINFLALPRLLDILRLRPADLCIDFGGGTGLFARLMRDAGYNFHTYDKFGSAEFAGAFRLDDIDRRCALMTLFEVVEHFAEPAGEWARIFATDPDFVIGSTSLFEGQGPQWPYLSPESGQHVFFYTQQAFDHIARRHGRHAYRIGMYFLLARQPLGADRLAAIAGWNAALLPACRNTLEQWAQAPYAQASRDNVELTTLETLRASGARIALDGVFFRFQSGIARLWKSLLAEWSANGFGAHVVVIDRGRTAPRFANIRYVDAPAHQYVDLGADRRMLQEVCDREGVVLFTSTYYTTPLTTPAVMMVLDMIPEAMGFDLGEAQWVEKHRCIAYADAFLAISDSTARDLVRFVPGVASKSVQTTYCGSNFRAAAPAAVDAFKARHGVDRPYFLIAGGRTDYKNAALFFRAFERLGERRAALAVMCTHAYQLEPEFAACLGPGRLHTVVLSDDDLQCAYTGAAALAYPSRYEGFGLPVLEAMACACPVVACASSSVPEVGGEAPIYVGPDDVDAMQRALIAVQDAATRAAMVERGLEQARRFSWTRMAREVAQALASRAIAVDSAAAHRPQHS